MNRILATAAALLVAAPVAVMAAPAAKANGKAVAAPAAAGLTIAEAAIRSGRLVISGKVSKPGATIRVTGTALRTRASAKGAFTITASFVPTTCAVVIAGPDGALPLRIADCAPRGADGKEGKQGKTGPRGKAGAKGAKGETGPAGPAGPKGPTGVDGSEGPIGPAGQAGNTGPVGPAGPRGPFGDSDSFAGKIFQARVTGGGAMVSASPGVTVRRTTEGEFRLTFPRNVAGCASTAVASIPGQFPTAVMVLPGVFVGGGSNDLGVRTFALDADIGQIYNPQKVGTPFSIQVVCL